MLFCQAVPQRQDAAAEEHLRLYDAILAETRSSANALPEQEIAIMTSLRFILAGASLVLAGACGGNDDEIAQEVGDTQNNPQYVMPGDKSDAEQVLTQEPDPSRDAEEELIPTPDAQTDLEPEIDAPITPDTGAEPQSMAEDGMPEPETDTQPQ